MKRIALILAGTALVAAPVLAAEDGAALYKAKCAGCHGVDGVTKKMGEPSRNLNDPKLQAEATKESIAKVVAEGKGKMKPVKLAPEQIDAVAAHVKAMK